MSFKTIIFMGITAVLLLVTACTPTTLSDVVATASINETAESPPTTNAVRPTPTQETTISSLDGTSWQLIFFQEGNTSYPPAGTITAEFADDQIGGNTGCNSYGGTFTIEGPALTISELMQTLQACLDEAVMQQETTYTIALQNAQFFAIEGDVLTVTYPNGSLVFTRSLPTTDVPFEETIWQLTTFTTGTVAHSLVAGTEITAQFSNGQLTGSAGCNSYFATYTIANNIISISGIGSTKMACAEDIMAQETSFLSFLGDAAAVTVTLSESQLILLKDGDSLTFSPQ